MPAAGAVLLGIFGVWLTLQATAGRLAGRLLSYREIRPGEVPTPAPSSTSSGPSTAGPSSSTTPGTGIAGAIHQYAWPVHGTITQVYGHNGHPGIDIGVPTGTPVGAIAAGTVILARWNNGYGNQVQVDHGGGRVSSVAHLSAISVKQGDQVTQGQQLGLAGSTGNSTGPHVHLEIRDNGKTLDPAPIIGGAP
jgi:murein DD-endopeptidase MepM/ murein hydrolase activator NlpD